MHKHRGTGQLSERLVPERDTSMSRSPSASSGDIYPAQSISKRCLGVGTDATIISFGGKVPVLSVHMTETEPRVSMTGKPYDGIAAGHRLDTYTPKQIAERVNALCVARARMPLPTLASGVAMIGAGVLLFWLAPARRGSDAVFAAVVVPYPCTAA